MRFLGRKWRKIHVESGKGISFIHFAVATREQMQKQNEEDNARALAPSSTDANSAGATPTATSAAAPH